MDGLISQLVNVGNRKFGGTYIFGGQANTDAPFDDVGEFVYFCGVHPAMMRNAKVIVEAP